VATTITGSSKIQLTLAVSLLLAAIGLYPAVYAAGGGVKEQMVALAEKVEERYISKELFNARFESMQRESDVNLRAMRDSISELKAEVAALRAVSGQK
jgi:hypothetical protein